MRFVKFSFIILMATAVVLLAGCSGNSNKKEQNSSLVYTLKKDQVKTEVAEFVYPLPTAFEVTQMLNRIGASYILSLSNPAENAEKYFTEKSRALNLGVYSADLSYASTYNQKQITIDYMNASNKLIEELDFSDAIDENLPEKIEQAENDKDQMIELITNTFYNTYEFLNKTNRGSVSVLVLAGSWVEGLYIAMHISEDTYNNVEMVKMVMDQKEPLQKLMDLITEHASDNAVAETGTLLTPIHTIYSELGEGSISQSQMEAIAAEVAGIREQIVK